MIDITRVKTYSVRNRRSKVKTGDFAKVPGKGASFARFYGSLPNILKAREVREVVDAIVKARKKHKAVIYMGGAHVIKCGLNPVLIELIKKKVITCVVLNGAGIIHDFEIAFQGKTSEDVGESLKDGSFGMALETATFINGAIEEGVKAGFGLGESVARKIAAAKLAHKDLSLLYAAYKHAVPVYVCVAIGTDIIHQHPTFDAGLTAQGSGRDFYQFVEQVIRLNQGGVVLNFGSAVLLPELFLKALNLARNLKHAVKDFVAANFDMVYQYRPAQNVVIRPVMSGGKGYYIVGHHEFMLPLLAQAVIEKIG